MKWTSVDPVFVVEDVEKSMQWYADLFGFAAIHVNRPPHAPVNYAVLRRDDVVLHLMRKAESILGLDAPSQAQFRINEGVDALFQSVKAKGAAVIQEPADQEWGRRDFTVHDLDLNVVWVGMPLKRP